MTKVERLYKEALMLYIYEHYGHDPDKFGEYIARAKMKLKIQGNAVLAFRLSKQAGCRKKKVFYTKKKADIFISQGIERKVIPPTAVSYRCNFCSRFHITHSSRPHKCRCHACPIHWKRKEFLIKLKRRSMLFAIRLKRFWKRRFWRVMCNLG